MCTFLLVNNARLLIIIQLYALKPEILSRLAHHCNNFVVYTIVEIDYLSKLRFGLAPTLYPVVGHPIFAACLLLTLNVLQS